MTLSNLPPLVTVFGGSGFIGRHVVRALAKRGYRIRVAVRRPDLAGFLQPLGHIGQISYVQANLRYRDSVYRAVQGADHVVNCVGILFETGRNTFDVIQKEGGKLVAEAARDVGASLTHLSAIGADANSKISYSHTKGRAEEAILSIKPDAVILRPSLVFGPEDKFFNTFANMARFSPVLPLIGGGKTRFQPVYVADVAEAVAHSVEGKAVPGQIYELGGPEALTFRECMEAMLSAANRQRPFVTLPFGMASLMGTVSSLMPFVTPVLTSDKVELLKSDNVVSPQAQSENRTLQGLGITPTALSLILPTYLVRYRPHGQYSGSGKAA